MDALLVRIAERITSGADPLLSPSERAGRDAFGDADKQSIHGKTSLQKVMRPSL